MQLKASEKTKKTHLEYNPTIEDLMTEEVFSLNENDTFNMVDSMMKWRRIRHVPVVNDFGQLMGLITHRDFLKVAVSRLADMKPGELKEVYENIKVKDVMQKDVLAAPPSLPVSEAAQLMHNHRFGCLPIVRDDKLVGIITEADFVKAFFDWDVKFCDE